LEEDGRVIFVDQRRAGVDEERIGCERIDLVVGFERGWVLMVDLVENLQSVEAHGVGLLRDGGVDASLLDELESGRVDVHRDEQAILGIVALEDFGDFLAAAGFETDESIDFVCACFQDVDFGAIEGGA